MNPVQITTRLRVAAIIAGMSSIVDWLAIHQDELSGEAVQYMSAWLLMITRYGIITLESLDNKPVPPGHCIFD